MTLPSGQRRFLANSNVLSGSAKYAMASWRVRGSFMNKRYHTRTCVSTSLLPLAPNGDLIYGAQSLGGKILVSKNLRGEIRLANSQNGTVRNGDYRYGLDDDRASPDVRARSDVTLSCGNCWLWPSGRTYFLLTSWIKTRSDGVSPRTSARRFPSGDHW